MNKYLLLMVLLVGRMSLGISQNAIPNPGFEDWTAHTGFGSYETPDGWQTLNQLTALATVFTAKKDAPGYSGNYAVRLQGIAGVPFVGTVPGILSSGIINQQTFAATGGFGVNFRPLEFKGYYKYDLTAGLDTATIAIFLTKWNTSTSSRDTVGIGGTQFKTDQQTYVAFNAFIIPLPFNSTVIPDTVSILILSGSLTSANPGALYLDDLSFYPVSAGIEEVNFGNHDLIIYNNNAASSISIKYPEFRETTATVVISDITGRAVGNVILKEEITTFNTGSFAPGLYFYNIIGEDKKSLATGKFTINK